MDLLQIISGSVSLFLCFIGIRVISPFINMITGFTWDNTMMKYGTLIGVYLVITFFVYLIIYQTLRGKMPQLAIQIAGKNEEEGGVD